MEVENSWAPQWQLVTNPTTTTTFISLTLSYYLSNVTPKKSVITLFLSFCVEKVE